MFFCIKYVCDQMDSEPTETFLKRFLNGLKIQFPSLITTDVRVTIVFIHNSFLRENLYNVKIYANIHFFWCSVHNSSLIFF